MKQVASEEWRAIPSVPHCEVSSLGRVRHADSGALLSTWLAGQHRYHVVSLKPGGKRYVHHLVAEAFIGPRSKGYWVLHRNGDQRDNRRDNLYYGTPGDNVTDAIRHGTIRRNGRDSALLEEELHQLRHMLREPGQTHASVAREFGLSRSTVTQIDLGLRFQRIKTPGWVPREPRKFRPPITPEVWDEVKLRLSRGEAGASIARALDLGDATVSKIKTGKLGEPIG